MKKALIFGLGVQGKKYIDFFKNKGFIVDGVNKSGINNDLVDNLYTFELVGKNNNLFFSKYDYIVVAIKPYSEQDKVINFLYSMNLTNKIIIEKPVTYNLDLFIKLLNKENYYFFIDELFFGNLFKNIKFKQIYLSIPNYDIEIFEHAMGIFLFNKYFENLLKILQISSYDSLDYNNLNYSIGFGNHNFTCNKGIYYLNNKNIGNIFFSKALENLLKINKGDSKLYKENFYLLENYIKDKFI